MHVLKQENNPPPKKKNAPELVCAVKVSCIYVFGMAFKLGVKLKVIVMPIFAFGTLWYLGLAAVIFSIFSIYFLYWRMLPLAEIWRSTVVCGIPCVYLWNGCYEYTCIHLYNCVICNTLNPNYVRNERHEMHSVHIFISHLLGIVVLKVRWIVLRLFFKYMYTFFL